MESKMQHPCQNSLRGSCISFIISTSCIEYGISPRRQCPTFWVEAPIGVVAGHSAQRILRPAATPPGVLGSTNTLTTRVLCLRPGTLVRFSARTTPVVGDIVLLRYPNDKLVAHRVVGLDASWVQTKGDSCALPDGPVPSSHVIGCAVSLQALISVPLRNFWMRRTGLLMSRLYPSLVRRYRSILPRKDETFAEAS